MFFLSFFAPLLSILISPFLSSFRVLLLSSSSFCVLFFTLRFIFFLSLLWCFPLSHLPPNLSSNFSVLSVFRAVIFFRFSIRVCFLPSFIIFLSFFILYLVFIAVSLFHSLNSNSLSFHNSSVVYSSFLHFFLISCAFLLTLFL